jgi:hypothetical protein
MPHVKRDFEIKRKKVVRAIVFPESATVFVRIRRLDLRIRRGPHSVRPPFIFLYFHVINAVLR